MLFLRARENSNPEWKADNYMNLIVNIFDDAENIIFKKFEFF